MDNVVYNDKADRKYRPKVSEVTGLFANSLKQRRVTCYIGNRKPRGFLKDPASPRNVSARGTKHNYVSITMISEDMHHVQSLRIRGRNIGVSG